jgi:hypothetical protein
MASNHATLALEVLSYYRTHWNTPVTDIVENISCIREENGQRVMDLMKSALIMSLSSYEYTAKQAVISNRLRLPELGGRIYLRRIVQESAKLGLIPPEDKLPWEGIFEMRNTLVHNNGIAELTATYAIPGTPGIVFVAGSMTQGNLKLFPQLLLWSVEAYGRWCDGFLQRGRLG